MDRVAQNLLQELNCNLKNIALYLDKLTREEIKIDSSKIFLIDYSQYLWLNQSENDQLRKQLEEYNRQSVHDIINDDFIEFCRKIYLQIEILLNQFIAKEYGNDKIQDNSYYKKNKLADFFKAINSKKENFNPYDHEEYKMIINIMDIRDVASHGDWNGKSIEERIEAKRKIKIGFRNLDKNKITEEKLKKIFFKFLINPEKNIKIYNNFGQGWAYITLGNLKNEFLDVDKVLNDVRSNLKILQYQLGNKVEIFADNKQPQNYLKDFFKQKDYQKIHNTMNWFIEKIGNSLK
ncbi:hypothetical protein ANSO36C_42980 [Nostoc cf. commune SO-36]|uniref:RiboL-PSP-HEPN domain-containing protein n=1 Tax=Nostoc cf. commune SO-36 TaxID=449208 RepID=A0ABN6Q5R0_NOSCO|nr:hypothetical protein [Nostoc commune]BDI18496.1 hypothetical protein ANSO36C_42980 [Nostoc cf. commune SO-36]